MSPTKQAKSQGNSGKELKLHQVTEWRKKPWEKPDSVYQVHWLEFNELVLLVDYWGNELLKIYMEEESKKIICLWLL